MDSLDGKVAVVTGAASGIGLALSERFLNEGMNVVLADVNGDGAQAHAERLAGQHGPGRVLAVQSDVSNLDSVRRLATAALSEFGAVHVLCNNAGISGSKGPIWEMDTQEWTRTLNIMVWGVINGYLAFVPHLVAQDEGHVVNTASLAGLTVLPFGGPYAAAKHAVVSMSESLAADLAMVHSHVGVSVLCPSWVNTSIWTNARDVDGGTRSKEALRTALAKNGMDPANVADIVVRGILEPRFYLLTHPEFLGLAKVRSDTLLSLSPEAPLQQDAEFTRARLGR